MKLERRIADLERRTRGRPRADQFGVVQAVPVGDEAAEGRPVGLHRTGSPGSTCGMLVFDPADGEPVVPEGRLAPWGLLIVHGPEYVEPPAELPGENGV
jgi:hypothetical protein